jgi:uncharacterized protein (UPF0276 family)
MGSRRVGGWRRWTSSCASSSERARGRISACWTGRRLVHGNFSGPGPPREENPKQVRVPARPTCDAGQEFAQGTVYRAKGTGDASSHLSTRGPSRQRRAMQPFSRRVTQLPTLGMGVSTEYGAHRATGALDIWSLASTHPAWVSFVELGIEADKGLDDDGARWVSARRPCTYHFLDVNLHHDDDFDEPWLARVNELAAICQPAWMCGDAGLWHFGPRDRGHMLLLPPILVDEAATAMARGVARLREASGREVLPENPPGALFVGDLSLLDFFGRVCERADTGMLLDVAHLAMYQRATRREPLDGLDCFALDRVVEVHVAGGTERTTADGFSYIDDSHGPEVLDDTWQIFEYVIGHARNLRAVVFECERNDNTAVVESFEKVAALWGTRRA